MSAVDDLTRERYPVGAEAEATREPSPPPQSYSARHDRLARLARERALRRQPDDDTGPAP